jgi:uncharacterized protein HemY
LENYLVGLDIDKKHGNRFNLAGDYIMLGELYLEMEQLTLAEKYFLDAVKSAKELNSRMELAEAYDNLGFLYKLQSKERKASDFWRLAQEIYKQIDLKKSDQIKDKIFSLNL